MSKLEKKMRRKIKKSITIMEKFEGIETVENATRILLIGNGGLVNGIQYETLMRAFDLYGQIEELVMRPDRPYAFIIYQCKDSAVDAMQNLNGSSHINADGTTVYFYLSYVNKVPDLSCSLYASQSLPPGLVLLCDFVSAFEEQELLECVTFEDNGDTVSQSLKHRAVRHYGFEFKYGSNDVDKTKPLEVQIPAECNGILQRIVELGYSLPDQLTVNRYLRKQGIPPHIDTHSAFEDGIMSLSLGSQVVMEFKHPSGKHCSVYLPRRSLLIMTGESRYLWTHGISLRKMDIVPLTDDNGKQCLTLTERATRTSFTFRKIRQGDCECGYSAVCNSKKIETNEKENLALTLEQAKRLEKKHVSQVYEKIADHFSDTRHKPWPEIAKFLESLPSGSLLLDVGCGNGKNLGLNSKLIEIGLDISGGLLGICHSRGIEVFQADGLNLPLRSGIADACLSIAVLHHFSTQERREQALSEIARLLKPGGLALIYVWALEQEDSMGPSNYIKTSRVKTLSQTVDNPVCPSACHRNNVEAVEGINLPVHKNRTNFSQQDLLVPWQYKNSDEFSDASAKGNSTFYRFYHVFKQHELESYANNIESLSVEKSYYDKGNWCAVVKKKVHD